MTDAQQETQNELLGRLELIETMMREGRRITEYWGWTQVLWGAAYLIAIGWASSSMKPQLAWPVTMIAAAVIMIVLIRTRKHAQPPTATSRAIRAIWIAVGAALFLFCFSVGISGHYEGHAFLAAVEVLLGVANFSSAMILRWRPQFVVAVIWWVAAVATCFVRAGMVIPILVIATLVGMIGFGLYLMYCERRDRRARMQHA